VKICVIDDERSITTMLSRFLTVEGHDVVAINDGRSGLSALEKEVFDVVLLDIAMPEFSGLNIVDSLNESGRIKDQKICIITASSVIEVELYELKSKGVKEIITKPIKLENLLSTLEKIVSSS